MKQVILYPKVANTEKAENFRPINMLPCLEKVLLIYEQLVDYFNENHLFLYYQSGFRKDHSCETSLQ